MLKPKLLTTLKTYDRQSFFQDLSAGVIVGIIALPLCIALAIASGVSPEKGLITGVVGGLLVSLLGGSRVQIAGPTGAFVVLVLGVVTTHGLTGLALATLMAGLILIGMGLLKMGEMIQFIPYPITTGFTCGIAVVIFSTQVGDFLGLSLETVPSEFLEKWMVYLENLHTVTPAALALAVLSVGIIVLWPRLQLKLPGTLVAIVGSTMLSLVFSLPVETIGSRFGEISGNFSAPVFPPVSLDLIRVLLPSAVAIALLGAIESLLSAVVADGMTGGNHRSNMELVAQGTANVFSALLGGIPVTGAIARTAANVKNGGRTPVAGIVHALVLLLMMLVLMPYVRFIPMASLAAVLVVVAWNMGEWEQFGELARAPRSDALVFLLTFGLTVIFDLVIAIEVGMVLTAFLFMKRMSEVTDVLPREEETDREASPDPQKPGNRLAVYEINGPFFFGVADKFLRELGTLEQYPRTLILKMDRVPFIDATGYSALHRLYSICRRHHTRLILSGTGERTMGTLERYGFPELIGPEACVASLDEALQLAGSGPQR